MNSTPAQIAIAKLIELAETGEIDPWDVQVIEIIDRFLKELPEKADLAQSGQTFLWASMLVLLKANSLTEPEVDTIESLEPETELELATRNPRVAVSLEKHLRRRTSAPPLRQRRVTLTELITQIRELEAKFTEKTRVKRSKTSAKVKAQLITQLAHQENLTEIANSLGEFLDSHKEFELTCLQLEELLILFNSQDRVGVFWALLLLSAESKVELIQEQFYQDLTIKPIYP
ncbi:MAG: segregation/condensation protein A [Gloeocapsa sp. DLM2.Bin57]|nr:MAG: segregation/condensation protein A [Gloeocapsa sp. DLM2.Bin57]